MTLSRAQSSNMRFWQFSSVATLISIFLAGTVDAIGPVTDLHIVNAEILPDGFSRPAVLADGQFPGPLITGNKACAIWLLSVVYVGC